MKYATLLVTLALAGWRMYILFHTQGSPLGKSSFPGVPAAQAAQLAQATGHASTPAPATPKATPAPATAADTARQDIEAQIRALKVSSIMPGQPGLAIINKESYAEGDDLPLKGRTLHVVRVEESGITLAANGQTFHLDPPAAPDLAASRKPRQ